MVLEAGAARRSGTVRHRENSCSRCHRHDRHHAAGPEAAAAAARPESGL